ncbi:multidrug efflux SMR transporter [Alkalihalophilus lindianensis]|uniref:Multidrug efflux SMR transporter n=1 Tax=Alkalihalophilus lindianensis TaxID=1630542 RepID=A0ABU3X4L1_9BACI|nr:multidrug efflux SMR transporter [Alkalihalophilus lindianensis]MDV2682821.1 multidrug efflux SMR transporter [Alkalihalophilus lindianensis]
MAWFYLIAAGVMEIVGVTMITKLHQERSWRNIVYLIGGFGTSFIFLALAMESLPMSTAYAIWTGIGASGGVLIGMTVYGEPRNVKRILFLSMILGAAVGLKLIS